MSKIGLIVIVSSAALGATYYSTGGSALLGIFAMFLFGLAAVVGFFVAMSMVFCMFFLPVIEVGRFIGGRVALLTKRS